MATATPAISVVVMGYRNADTIVRAARSVLTQECGEPFEVVVVTSGGDDSAARVRRELPGVAVIESAVRIMPGAARNAGVAATSGEHVAFLAADCVAEPGWLTGRLRAHRAGWPVVASAMTNLDRRSPVAWATHFSMYSARQAGRRAGVVAAHDPACHGLSFARSLLERLGPFDEARRIGEDTEMAARLPAVGAAAWFAPDVRTAHAGPRGARAMVRDRARRAARRAADGDPDPAGAPRLLVRSWATGVRSTVVEAWATAGRDRPWLLVALPGIVLWQGAAAWGARPAGAPRASGSDRR